MEYKQKKKEETKERFQKMYENVKYWILDHKKIVMPVVLVVFLVVTVLIAVGANKRKKEADAVEATNLIANEVTNAAMELNAYPVVNELISAYYDALEVGDAEAALKINGHLSETEQLYIQEMGNVIDRFTTIEVYTKPGPVENSFLAYVYYEVKFKGSEVEGPGMTAYYICCDDDGAYYINEGKESEEITAYIEEMSLQDDVVELNNRVSVAFNDLITNDLIFSQFYSDLLTQLSIRVGDALAEIEPDEVEADVPDVTETADSVVIEEMKGTTTDVVNIRSSASESADKKGKAQKGQSFDIIKIWENGWTEVKYEGGSGFIKSEYITVVNEAQENNTGTSTGEVIGTVTANTTVNIRSEANQSSEKVGVVYEGEKLDLLEKRTDGWSKVLYNGKTAYVKTEFLK